MICLLAIAAMTSMERSGLSFLEEGVRDFFAPVKKGAVVVYQRLSLIPQFFTGVNELLEENQNLQREVANLRNELTRLQEADMENVYLRDLLKLSRQMQGWQPVAAGVIGRSTDTWYSTITINGGKDKGFAKDMPIITTEGLVGRILAVSDSTSEVLLITDKESAVGSMVQVSHMPGVVEGFAGADKMNMIHIPYDARLVKDQVVVTSGLGGIYPRGLRIGYITEVSG
ncbi:MAG: rod shape-determining protein MreC, partial [Clostridiales bacterium]